VLYKKQGKEILGRGSLPWTIVSKVKQKLCEDPLKCVERFSAALYENECAANDNDEVYGMLL